MVETDDLANPTEEVRRLANAVEVMEQQLARLTAKVQRPDLVKYSVKEACERMGRSRASIYKEINAGRLVPVKERGRTYLTEEIIQA